MATSVKAPPVRKTKGEPPPHTKPSANLAKPVPQGLRPLNFRVPAAFHQEFKVYAASHGMSMLELLQKAFERYKESTK
jgi:hypothetical protein